MTNARAANADNDNSRWFRAEYNGFQKFGQAAYKFIGTAAVSSAFPLTINFPYNVAGYMASYVVYGEGLDKLLKLCKKDQLWLRQLGGGNVCKGITKELLSSAFAAGFTGAAAYGLVYMNAMYMQDWLVSDDPLIQAFANTLYNPETAMPIFGAAAYFLWKAGKALGMKFWDCCCPADPERLIHYPDLNLIQIAGDYALNTAVSIGDTALAVLYINYAGHEAIGNNKHLQMGIGVGAFLLDNAFKHLFFIPKPIDANIRREERLVNVYNHIGDDPHPGLDVPGCGRALIDTSGRAGYYLIMAALMCVVYEIVNFADRDTRLHDDNSSAFIAARLAIMIGTIRLLDFILRQATPVVSNCVHAMFGLQRPANPQTAAAATNSAANAALLEEGRARAPDYGATSDQSNRSRTDNQP